MIDEFTTIKNEYHYEYVEKRSVFIGHIYRVDDIQMATNYIQHIKKQYSDARHNVFGYKIGDYEKYSDDGEPQGTAGLPILSVIKKNSINNCIIIITRYFGGVLLGTAGLMRAYTNTASNLVENAEKIRIQTYNVYHLIVSYNKYDKVQKMLSKENLEMSKVVFNDNVEFDVYVGNKDMEWFKNSIMDAYNLIESYNAKEVMQK